MRCVRDLQCIVVGGRSYCLPKARSGHRCHNARSLSHDECHMRVPSQGIAPFCIVDIAKAQAMIKDNWIGHRQHTKANMIAALPTGCRHGIRQSPFFCNTFKFCFSSYVLVTVCRDVKGRCKPSNPILNGIYWCVALGCDLCYLQLTLPSSPRPAACLSLGGRATVLFTFSISLIILSPPAYTGCTRVCHETSSRRPCYQKEQRCTQYSADRRITP
jgi:hypothetical protein